MDHIAEFADERQRSWCVHCGEWIASLESNRDHVPSKSLLKTPFPDNLPVIPVCKFCNTGFSLDEEYVAAFLGAVLSGSTEPERQPFPSAARILRRNAKLKARIERAKTEYRTHGGESRVDWAPEQDRVNRIVIKNARGHAFFEYGEPMLASPDHVWAVPLKSMTEGQRAQFENIDPGSGWPEVGSRMMTRVMSGRDMSGSWIHLSGRRLSLRYGPARHLISTNHSARISCNRDVVACLSPSQDAIASRQSTSLLQGRCRRRDE